MIFLCSLANNSGDPNTIKNIVIWGRKRAFFMFIVVVSSEKEELKKYGFICFWLCCMLYFLGSIKPLKAFHWNFYLSFKR